MDVARESFVDAEGADHDEIGLQPIDSERGGWVARLKLVANVVEAPKTDARYNQSVIFEERAVVDSAIVLSVTCVVDHFTVAYKSVRML